MNKNNIRNLAENNLIGRIKLYDHFTKASITKTPVPSVFCFGALLLR